MVIVVLNTANVNTFAGSTASGYVDGSLSAARFKNPAGLSIGSDSTIFVADYNNHAIRMISSSQVVTTIAGSGPTISGSINGFGTSATMYTVRGVSVSSSNIVFVADYENGLIRRIDIGGAILCLSF